MGKGKYPVPVIKWAGGKRQLLPKIVSCLPVDFHRYYEPFFGGGALFCELMPVAATVNDVNEELIHMYLQIKENPDKVCRELSDLEQIYNGKILMEEKDVLYYEWRNLFNQYLLKKEDSNSAFFAALMIFLNKAGFNGLYRVNSSGMYNVPSAHRKFVRACDADNIMALSNVLRNTEILCGDFADVCQNAVAGDFVFFDSPYYGTFDHYQTGGFSESDHLRLFDLFVALSRKGVFCMMTNSNCDFIRHLYRDFLIETVDVKRMINCDGKHRVGQEVIVRNYCE